MRYLECWCCGRFVTTLEPTKQCEDCDIDCNDVTARGERINPYLPTIYSLETMSNTPDKIWWEDFLIVELDE